MLVFFQFLLLIQQSTSKHKGQNLYLFKCLQLGIKLFLPQLILRENQNDH